MLASGIPVPAHAAGKLIAAVFSSDLPRYRIAHRALVKALAQRGFDQSAMEMIVQTPNPDPISWANTIRKFIAIGADLVVAYGAPVTLAAAQETQDIPIVFVDVYGPVETGITRSMTMSGRNLAGVSSKIPMSTLIKTAMELKPIRTMGVLYNSREIGSLVQLQEIKRIAVQHGFAVIESSVQSMSVLDGALTSLLPQIDCLYISECYIGGKGFEKIIRKANDNKIPVISQMPEAAEKGALVSLEISPAEQGQIAGDYVAKILAGKKPGQMSIATPKKVDLIINMRAARILDLHAPFQALNSATKVLK